MIDGVLRGEWGFDGLVMSDWFGLHSTVEGVIAGLRSGDAGPDPVPRRGAGGGDRSRADVPVEHVREAARNVLER